MSFKSNVFDKFYDNLPPEDQRTIALNAIHRLIEMGEVRFREEDKEEGLDADLYWESCGESLIIPF